MDQTVIRRARSADALPIALVQAYTWKTTYAGLMPETVLDAMLDRVPARVQRWKEDLDRAEGFFVAELDGVVTGFASCGKARNPDFSNAGEVFGLYVLKSFQRQGVGKSLLDQCRGVLKARGYSSFLVNCLAGNPSLGFYEAMGGTTVGMRREQLGGAVLQEHILQFSLDGAAV